MRKTKTHTNRKNNTLNKYKAKYKRDKYTNEEI